MSEARGGVSASLRQRVDASQREGAEASTGLIPSRTIGDLVDEIAQVLGAGCVPEPFNEAREIVAALHEQPRFWPTLHSHAPVDCAMWERAHAAARKRCQGAPLAYAVGRASFRHLTIELDERALIPRPETEQLVDLVLDAVQARAGGIAIDVGTGSGAIALSLAMEGRFSRVYGADVSLDALAVARRNVERAERLLRAPVELVAGSLLHPLLHLRARAIVSNPPYIAFGEAGALPASVRDWEPPAALFAGHDGLAATTALVRQAIDVLEPGGVLAMEVDSQRAPLVAELVAHDPRYDHVRVERDLTGRERFVLARRQETDG